MVKIKLILKLYFNIFLINIGKIKEDIKQEILHTDVEQSPHIKPYEEKTEPLLTSSGMIQQDRKNRSINDITKLDQNNQNYSIEENNEIKNKIAYDYNKNIDIRKSLILNIKNNPQIEDSSNNRNKLIMNNYPNEINSINYFISLSKNKELNMNNKKKVLCPNLHEDLQWSGEKKECQECENINYGFLCTVDSYFICFRCYEYTISKECPHSHELKWIGNKKCFNCCEVNFCMHCEKDNYSVCYKCYNYDFKQTFCPNKHEYKYYNFKSCFLCKKKNKCLGCEKDDFYLCLCNMNKNDNDTPNDLYDCSIFRTLPKYQFKSHNCILGHNLIWKKIENSCYRCENTSQIGLFCQICEFYSHCIECFEFKFPILDCPNNHGSQCYKWVSDKKDCLRCKKHHTGYYCSKCEYFLCRKNCVNTIIKKFTGKDRPNIDEQNIKNELVLERLNPNQNLFSEDDKNSFMDCSIRDIKLEDLNQSTNSINIHLIRKPDLDFYKHEINKGDNKVTILKTNESLTKENESNNILNEFPNKRVLNINKSYQNPNFDNNDVNDFKTLESSGTKFSKFY